MIEIHSSWLATHGKLWYDDTPYRAAWILWPQALAITLVLWFWALPPSSTNAPWIAPMDLAQRASQLDALRDRAKASRTEMALLEREVRTGDPLAQFYYATLYDPDLKLSAIIRPDLDQAIYWYSLSAAQGDETSANNLAGFYSTGVYMRPDYSRACPYARRVTLNGSGVGLRVKGECYARGLGETPVDLVQAADAYEAAAGKGDASAAASAGYFYENGLGNRPRNPEIALRYYRTAADAGNALGLHNLGYSYNAGLLGLRRDGAEAARLIVRALDAKYDVTVQSLLNHAELWTSDFWAKLQRHLADRGIYSGPIDGRGNPATLEAVKRLGGR